jgi:hypothetical protein
MHVAIAVCWPTRHQQAATMAFCAEFSYRMNIAHKRGDLCTITSATSSNSRCRARRGSALRRVHPEIRSAESVFFQHGPDRFRRALAHSFRPRLRRFRPWWRNSGLAVDMLFGPAYKGIALAAATAIALADQHQRDLPWAYNRKEAKDHGEGGVWSVRR